MTNIGQAASFSGGWAKNCRGYDRPDCLIIAGLNARAAEPQAPRRTPGFDTPASAHQRQFDEKRMTLQRWKTST
ncbi:hypothetical protein BOH74_01460 [Pseudomonas versuta]|uniref:Uncharacterized protein n=1 Tax=Pseudomonas versuta TaxID=1788301 RepID=A0A853ZWU3_9PSED|nr:hypothetical protein BOH74_01460 [Pseudomonas versuta]